MHGWHEDTPEEETSTAEEFLQAQASDPEGKATAQTVGIPTSLLTYECDGVFVQQTGVHGEFAEVRPILITHSWATSLQFFDPNQTAKKLTSVRHNEAISVLTKHCKRRTNNSDRLQLMRLKWISNEPLS